MLAFTTYKKTDDKPWITFIHGAGGSSAIWFKQVRFFAPNYNVLLIDLRGHGASAKQEVSDKPYTFIDISTEVIEVLDHLKIQKSHFVGISLGSILICKIAQLRPDLCLKLVPAGAILQLNLRAQILMNLGKVLKNLVPYLWLYRFFAWIIMPRKNHEASRRLFIREAKRLRKGEFIRWYRLTLNVNAELKILREGQLEVPALFISGSEDFMFLPSVTQTVKGQKWSKLEVIPNCGHVVNVEKSDLFNSLVSDFLID